MSILYLVDNMLYMDNIMGYINSPLIITSLVSKNI